MSLSLYSKIIGLIARGWLDIQILNKKFTFSEFAHIKTLEHAIIIVSCF